MLLEKLFCSPVLEDRAHLAACETILWVILEDRAHVAACEATLRAGSPGSCRHLAACEAIPCWLVHVWPLVKPFRVRLLEDRAACEAITCAIYRGSCTYRRYPYSIHCLFYLICRPHRISGTRPLRRSINRTQKHSEETRGGW